MNIFRSNSAPYALVLLVAVLGWLLNSFWSELTASRAISYDLKLAPPGAQSSLHIRNISRLKTVKDFTFSLVCTGAPCFNRVSDTYSSPIYHSPFYAQSSKEAQSSFEIGYKVTLVAGAHFQIDFQRNAAPGNVRFFYRPQSASEELYVFEESIATKAVRHALDIFFWALALTIAGFVIMVVISLFSKREEVKDDKPEELIGGIYRHRDEQSARIGGRSDDPSGGEGEQSPGADPKPREDHDGQGTDEGGTHRQ